MATLNQSVVRSDSNCDHCDRKAIVAWRPRPSVPTIYPLFELVGLRVYHVFTLGISHDMSGSSQSLTSQVTAESKGCI